MKSADFIVLVAIWGMLLIVNVTLNKINVQLVTVQKLLMEKAHEAV